MYHYIYKITHIDTNRYYIGRHSTENLDDGYMGSGTHISRAIKKYGKDSFKKEILKFTDTYENLIELETSYITPDIILDENCFNLAPGGLGGTTTEMWTEERRLNHSKIMSEINSTEDKKIKVSNTVKKRHAELGKNYWSEDGFNSMTAHFKENSKEWAKLPWSEKKKENHRLGLLQSETVGKYTRTDEIKAKHSISRSGKGTGDANSMANPEHRAKVSLSKVGRKRMRIEGETTSKYVKPENFQMMLDAGYTFCDKEFTI